MFVEYNNDQLIIQTGRLRYIYYKGVIWFVKYGEDIILYQSGNNRWAIFRGDTHTKVFDFIDGVIKVYELSSYKRNIYT